jgi:hypothetical protein
MTAAIHARTSTAPKVWNDAKTVSGAKTKREPENRPDPNGTSRQPSV